MAINFKTVAGLAFKSHIDMVFNKIRNPSLAVVLLKTRYLNDKFMRINSMDLIILLVRDFMSTAGIHHQIVIIRLWELETHNAWRLFAINFNFANQRHLRVDVYLRSFKSTYFLMHVNLTSNAIQNMDLSLDNGV